MAGTIRGVVKQKLIESRLSYRIIADESGVPYDALYYFATKGNDMRSEHMEKLYIYFTGKPVVTDES